MKIERVWEMPNPATFEIPSIAALIKKYSRDSRVIVDPFARNNRVANYTNDLDPNTESQYHLTAEKFLQGLSEKGISPDLVLFDPPYSLRQCAEVYKSVGLPVTMRDTQGFGRWVEHKDIISNMMPTGGLCISFGWNSSGIGLKRGFNIEEILLVCHGSAHNDTICTVERKIQGSLFT